MPAKKKSATSDICRCQDEDADATILTVKCTNKGEAASGEERGERGEREVLSPLAIRSQRALFVLQLCSWYQVDERRWQTPQERPDLLHWP
mmetsp:Transcript_28915/g.83546  ORF Transcript_28915/g.83546 Transcript_28915/m.83546 type:complete len:91 (+) Transcript_28915:2164-2436(+)